MSMVGFGKLTWKVHFLTNMPTNTPKQKIKWDRPLSEAPMWFQRLILWTELILFIGIIILVIL